MRWAQSGHTYGNPKWHLANPANEQNDARRSLPAECNTTISRPKWMAGDRRPGLARNNVCSRCKKAYLASRPDLQAAFDLLNDKRDV